jgi:hypothetical protein
MLIDHVLLALPWPWSYWGYMAGRPCIPVLAYVMVARLSGGGTDRCLRMLRRLLLWAAIAQPVYGALDGEIFSGLNVLFTLSLGASLVYLLERRSYLPAILLAGALPFFSGHLDGGAATPIGQALAYLCYRRSPAAALAIVTVTAMVQNFTLAPPSPEQVVMVLAAPAIVVIGTRLAGYVPALPRFAYYAFYSLHLAAIWIVFGPYP